MILKRENILKDKHYRILFESSVDAIFIVDGDRFVDCNSSTLEMFGVKKDEIINKTSYDFSPRYQPDGKSSKEKAQELIQTALEGNPQLFEWLHIKADGSEFTTEVRLSRVDYDDKSYILATVRDISARKITEKAMIENQELLNLSQEIAHVGTWSLDLETNHLFWSAEVYRIFGLDPEEFEASYEAFLDTIHPDDREMVDHAYTKAKNDNLPYEIQHRIIRPDGEIRYVHEKSIELHNEFGKTIKSIGIVQDITERKSSEEQLRIFQEKLAELVIERTAELADANTRLIAEIREREQAEKRLQEYADQLQMLKSFSSLVNQSLSIDELLETAKQGMLEYCSPDVVVIYLRQGSSLILRSAYPERLLIQDDFEGHWVGDCLCGLAVSENESFFSTDINNDPLCTRKECKKVGMQSFAALPIPSGNDVIGAFGMASKTKRDFSMQSDFLHAMGIEVGISLQKAILHQETENHAHRLEVEVRERKQAEAVAENLLSHQLVINQLALALGQTQDKNQIYNTVYQQLREIFDLRVFIVSKYDPKRRMIRADFLADGETLQDVSLLPELPLSEDSCGPQSKVILTGEPQLVSNYTKDVNKESKVYTVMDDGSIAKCFPPEDRPDESFTKSVLYAPMKIAGEVIGVMQVQSTKENAYSQQDLNLLSGISNVTAVAINNAMLFDQIKQHQEKLEEIVRERTKELSESEKRYRQVVDQSPMLIAVEENQLLTYLNQAGASILGIDSPEEAFGKSLIDFIQPEYRQSIYEYFEKLIIEKKSKSFVEYTCHFLDGRVRAMEISTLITQQNGTLTVQIIAMDITERKKVQQTLIRQAVLAEIDLTIYEPRDLQGALDKTVDIAKRSLPGDRGASIVLVDQKSDSFWVASIDIIRSAQLAVHRQIKDKNGPTKIIIEEKEVFVVSGPKQVEDWASPELTHQGIHSFIGLPLLVENEVLGVLYVFEFEPHQHSPEEIDFLKSLASRIALVITKVRLYETLLEARIAAEETARAKSEFLANMSHELRTPLTAVVSIAEMLSETRLTREQINFINSISMSAEKLLSMIDDVLDYSKIEANKLKLEELPFDLRECIEGSMDIIALQAAEKGIDFAYSVEQQIPQIIIGDSIRLSQVLINLLGNAVKFTEEGSVFLSVREAESLGDSKDSEKLNLHFEIHDSGIGIPADRVDRLFGVFSQLDSSITRKFGGTGLGLAISKHLVSLMQGDIWIESSGIPGEGSVFHFTIQSGSIPGTPEPYLHPDQPLLNGKKIAILCSYDCSRQALADQLSFWGMHVYPFANFEEAIRNFDHSIEFDMVFIGFQKSFDHLDEFLDRFLTPEKQKSLVWIQISPPGSPKILHESIEMSGILEIPIKFKTLYDFLCGSFDLSIKTLRMDQVSGDVTYLSKLRILLAEDDPTNQMVIKLMLNKMGYQVDVARSGIDVIQITETNQYDVIIMDLQMPEMDGLTATRYLRETLPDNQQPFIIALTADSRWETMEASISEGVNLFLTKPIRKIVLFDTLLELENELAKPETKKTLKERYGADPDVIDDRILSDLIDTFNENDFSSLKELVDSFLENGPVILEKMNLAANEENWDQVRHHAHALKGNCELFGAVNLANKNRLLEEKISSGDFVNIEALTLEINSEFIKVKQNLINKFTDLQRNQLEK